ncbi:hypothetical protein HII31_12348 [Pseudocercospora fuligena]|uniref:Uncharacterized protein n=1 Tax=Pseudocercospora fuligena TaxID=685502 RepID=A0A8H6R855_9PEZI|nr:hypothetical protein HII31_12348 [Pseudocercospora fuligena]
MSTAGTAAFPGSGTAVLGVNYYQRLITEQAIDAMPEDAQRKLFLDLTIAALNRDYIKEEPSGHSEQYSKGIHFILTALSGKVLQLGKPEHFLESVEDPDRRSEISALVERFVKLFDEHDLLHVWSTLKMHSLLAWVCMLPPAPMSPEAPAKEVSSQNDKEAKPASEDG